MRPNLCNLVLGNLVVSWFIWEKVKNECFDLCVHYEKSEEHNGEGRKIEEVLNEEGIELEKRLK